MFVADVAKELEREYDALIEFCDCEALIANELVTALEDETAKDALIAKDDDIANELDTALDDDTAKEAVPNREPVKLPVNDPVLYEEVNELNEEVVTKEPVLILVPPAFKAKEAVNA